MKTKSKNDPGHLNKNTSQTSAKIEEKVFFEKFFHKLFTICV